METFADEHLSVQLALLTATVKLFISQQNSRTCSKALTEASNSPSYDIRDRAHIYWRILFNHPEDAEAIITSQRDVITTSTLNLHSQVLQNLLGQLGDLSSVYQKMPASFVVKLKKQGVSAKLEEEEAGSEISDLLVFDGGSSNIIGSGSRTVLGFDDGTTKREN
ncbi:Clathrin/coatomer adaptor adaptin-like N-terminal domain-containing protein [Entamoeba marina]